MSSRRDVRAMTRKALKASSGAAFCGAAPVSLLGGLLLLSTP